MHDARMRKNEKFTKLFKVDRPLYWHGDKIFGDKKLQNLPHDGNYHH